MLFKWTWKRYDLDWLCPKIFMDINMDRSLEKWVCHKILHMIWYIPAQLKNWKPPISTKWVTLSWATPLPYHMACNVSRGYKSGRPPIHAPKKKYNYPRGLFTTWIISPIVPYWGTHHEGHLYWNKKMGQMYLQVHLKHWVGSFDIVFFFYFFFFLGASQTFMSFWLLQAS